MTVPPNRLFSFFVLRCEMASCPPMLTVQTLVVGLSSLLRKSYMVIDSLNLKLRQIARFSSNVIFDEMSSAKCRLHEERPLNHTSRCFCFQNGVQEMTAYGALKCDMVISDYITDSLMVFNFTALLYTCKMDGGKVE